MYYEIKPVIDRGLPFNIVIGGRGIGKTYSTLKWQMENNIHAIYLRTLQSDIDIVARPECNPYKVLNADMGYNYHIGGKKIKTILNNDGETVGYALALSTFASLRGVDFSDIDVIIWDEFILEGNRERYISDETTAFFNLYETVNRNREIKGCKPVQVIMMSNAVRITSPLLIGLNLVGTIERMVINGQKRFTDKERGIFLELPVDIEVSQLKNETALYRLAKNTRYAEHAINNRFVYDSWYNVARRNITEYTPYCAFKNVYIYRHKNNGEYYACTIRADCPAYDADTLGLFRRNHYLSIKEAYVSGSLIFDTIATKTLLSEVL